jgi:hypothetical protein
MDPSFGDLFGKNISNRKIKTYSLMGKHELVQIIEYPDGAIAERRKDKSGNWMKWKMLDREQWERFIRSGVYIEVKP